MAANDRIYRPAPDYQVSKINEMIVEMIQEIVAVALPHIVEHIVTHLSLIASKDIETVGAFFTFPFFLSFFSLSPFHVATCARV